MKLLIKSATILDDSSTFHNQTKDILIENDIIVKIDDSIENPGDYQEVQRDNLHISQGWFDSSVCFGEPGYEERETIANGLKTAALSGFSEITVQPNSLPIADNSTVVSFIKNNALNHAVSVHPIGALTRESKGVDLAELYDMKQSGAVAFGDFQKEIKNPNLLKIALLYSQNFDGLVISHPNVSAISGKGVVNEEETATRLGLKGIPNLAEELQVARDIFLLEYTEGKLHIPTISTAKSVALIREAKAKGLNISCSVAISHLILTDDAINEFDTNFKLCPPLRTKEDRKALIDGVLDGTIDFVTSHHVPVNVEHKKIEFDYADYGSIGLESAFGALNSVFDTPTVIRLLTQHKERFGLKNTSIETGQFANLTLFTPSEAYQFTLDKIHSTSKNAAFLGSHLQGKAYGIINNGKVLLN